MWRRTYLRCLRYLGPNWCMVMEMKVVVVKMMVDDMISIPLVFILIEMVNVDVFSYENVIFFS